MAERKPKNKKVSIIVATYNRPQLLVRALNSILMQSYKDFEIIVVNDGGIDIQEIVDEGNSLTENVIKYINNENNVGPSGARNLGLDEVTGSYIMFLDDDDILLPHALEFRVHMMEKLKAEVVYTRALQDIWEKNEEKNAYISVHKQLYWDSPFNKDLLLLQNIAPNCCVLFSKKAWDKSGNYKFDTSLETGEDYDFWIAISRNSDFAELGLIDVECSLRKSDNSQATGNKNFISSYPIIYKRWRDTAINKEEVIKHQNDTLKKYGLNPEDYAL